MELQTICWGPNSNQWHYNYSIGDKLRAVENEYMHLKFFCVHNLRKVSGSVQNVLENVQIAKIKPENLLDVKFVFGNVQIAKNILNVKMCFKMRLMQKCMQRKKQAYFFWKILG